MREIKFRAWDGKGMRYDKIWIATDTQTVGWGDGRSHYFHEVPTMQYTGLKDRNGQEIYEGDIFQVANNHKYTVKFISEYESPQDNTIYACFCMVQRSDMIIPFDEFAMSEGKVVGNIYENPELLENIKEIKK